MAFHLLLFTKETDVSAENKRHPYSEDAFHVQ